MPYICYTYMKTLYVIAGCNGAGKTTASYTILPEFLQCDEFVNADEIARGLSPFKPENTGFLPGRLMVQQIKSLLESGQNFAIETTLTTRSYKNLIMNARGKGYSIVLLFFWLESQDLAVKRVEQRVKEGGHHIPVDVVRRRYTNGLKNFFNIFKETVDQWMLINNSNSPFEIIGEGFGQDERIKNESLWHDLKSKYNG